MSIFSESSAPAGAPAAPRARVVVGAYVAAVAAVLAVEGLLSATAGAAGCAIALVALVNRHVATPAGKGPADGLLLALVPVPLAGMLFVSLPISEVPQAGWPVLVAAPVLLSVALAARVLGAGRRELGLTAAAPVGQLAVALAGVPLGLGAWLLLRPRPLADGVTIVLAVAALPLLAFTEELMLRGRLFRLLGATGVAWAAALSAAAALGARSGAAAGLAGVLAWVFGWWRHRTGSIAGPSGARALLLIGLFVLWPHLLG
jgi:hypothetical protein